MVNVEVNSGLIEDGGEKFTDVKIDTGSGSKTYRGTGGDQNQTIKNVVEKIITDPFVLECLPPVKSK